MKRVQFTLGIGFAGCTHKIEETFEDDVTEEELEEWYLEWRNNYLDGSWRVLDD